MSQDWRFLHPSRSRPLVHYIVSLSTRIFLYYFSSRLHRKHALGLARRPRRDATFFAFFTRLKAEFPQQDRQQWARRQQGSQ